MHHTEFGWDETKSTACAVERGFDFTYASRLFDGPVLERVDARQNYREMRIQAIGRIEGRLFVVVYTTRGDTTHIISARRAHQKEWDRWFK